MARYSRSVLFSFMLSVVSRMYPVSNKPVSLNYASWMTNHTLDRICDMDTYLSLIRSAVFLMSCYSWLMFLFRMPQHLRISPECVHPLSLLSDLCMSVGSQVTTMHSCLLMLVVLVVRQDILFQDVRRNKLQYLVHF